MEEYADLIADMELLDEDVIYGLPDILFHAVHEQILDEGFSWDSVVWVSHNNTVYFNFLLISIYHFREPVKT